MKISMIVAMTKERVIGSDGVMPWYLPADFAWFKTNTLGKPIIMGRKTHESIGCVLSGRRNIVLSRNGAWRADGVETAINIDEALRLVEGVDEVVIIGGGSIYAACLDRTQRLYLTHIDADIDGDTRFPVLGDEWEMIHFEQYKADVNNRYDMEFVILETPL